MAGESGVVIFIVLLSSRASVEAATSCLQCYAGLNTNCARDVPETYSTPCMSPAATCYEALISYQDGALQMVQRRCYDPTPAEPTFCSRFASPVGRIVRCRTCATDDCNGSDFIKLEPKVFFRTGDPLLL